MPHLITRVPAVGAAARRVSAPRVTSLRVAALLSVPLLAGTMLSGCGGGTPSAATTPGEPVAVGQGYTSDQLRQALLTDLVGYRRTGEPDSGEYGSLKVVQYAARMQSQLKIDRPECAEATKPTLSSPAVQQAPAAIIVFAKDDGHTVTETLLAVPNETAGRLVNLRVASGCRLFRTKTGADWSTHQVVEATGDAQFAAGSRTVGVVTATGSAQVKTWYVVQRGRGYVATLTLYGPNATRAEAEQLARQAHDQADRILP